MAGEPNFFLRIFIQLNPFLRRLKKLACLSSKLPDFSLAPGLGLDFVSAWNDLDTRTLASGTIHETFAILT